MLDKKRSLDSISPLSLASLICVCALAGLVLLSSCADPKQSKCQILAKVDISDIEPVNGYVSLDSAVEDYDEVMVSNPYNIEDDLVKGKIKQKVKGFEYNDFAIVIFIKEGEAVVFAEAKGELAEYLRKYDFSDTGKLYPKGKKFYK